MVLFFFSWKENGEKGSDLKKNLKLRKGFGKDDLFKKMIWEWFGYNFNYEKDPGSLVFYSTTYLSQEHFGASLLS